MTFTIKQGDTSPALRVALKYDDCKAVNTTDATVMFHMREYGGTTPVISAAGVVVSIGGIVEYRWAGGDTDALGSYEAEFEITYADGTVETFPSNGYIPVQVNEAIE
jgi:hypothetical protein